MGKTVCISSITLVSVTLHHTIQKLQQIMEPAFNTEDDA